MNRLRVPLVIGALAGSLAATAFADVSLTDRQALRHEGKRSRKADRSQSGTLTAPGSTALVDGSGLVWSLNSDLAFSTSSSASGAMREASYTGPVQATTASGGLVSMRLTDAFDGYGALCVSLTGATGPCRTRSADYVIYNRNGAATLEPNGRQLAFASQTIGDLSVSRKVFVPDTDSFARWLNVFRNDGAAPVTFNVISSNNLGSDSNTRIVTTSDGDGVATTSDKWVTTFQNYSGNTSSDPRLGHVLQGAHPRVPLSGVSFADGLNYPYWVYTVTLAPGQTGIVMSFAVAQPSKAAAASKSAALASLTGAALDHMTAQEMAAVLNFGSVKGDFDGDGRADILWQHQSTGTLYGWLMNGAAVAGGAAFTPAGMPDATWQLRALADFDGDGDTDLLWHNQKTGVLYFWYMSGAAVQSGGTLAGGTMADTAWQIRGVADVTGDGRPDLLWHNQKTGTLYVWFVSPAVGDPKAEPTGLAVTGGSYLAPSAVGDLAWQVRGLADFDGNGTADVLWHNQKTGQLYAWFLGPGVSDPSVSVPLPPATTVVGASFLTPSSVSDVRWQIQQLADFDGDGDQDLLWRHAASGQLYVWYLGIPAGDASLTGAPPPALTVISGGFLNPSALADAAWQVVPR